MREAYCVSVLSFFAAPENPSPSPEGQVATTLSIPLALPLFNLLLVKSNPYSRDPYKSLNSLKHITRSEGKLLRVLLTRHRKALCPIADRGQNPITHGTKKCQVWTFPLAAANPQPTLP